MASDDKITLGGLVEFDEKQAEGSARRAGQAAARAFEDSQQKAQKLGGAFDARKKDDEKRQQKREEDKTRKNLEDHKRNEQKKHAVTEKEHRRALRTHEEALREHQRRERHINQQRTAGFVSAARAAATLTGPLRHIPGGALLHGGISGAASSMAHAHQKGKGIGGVLAAGVGGGVGSMGMGLLDRAVSTMMQAFTGGERTFYQLAQAGGGDAALGRAVMKSSKHGLLRDEAAAYQMQALRAGGGAGAASDVTRLSHRGLGGEYAGMLHAVSQSGGAVGTDAVDKKSAKLWGEIMGSAIAQKLQSGRWGEMISGMTAFARSTTAGVVGGELGEGLKLQLKLAQQSSAFVGQAGFDSAARMEHMTKGGGGGLNRAVALMASGLGTPGTGYADARLMMERGITGEGANKNSASQMLSTYLRMFGGDKKMAAVGMADAGAASSANEALQWLEMNEKGSISDKDFEEMRKKAESEDKKLTTAMQNAQGSMHGLQKAIEGLGTQLAEIFGKTGVIPGLTAALNTLSTHISGAVKLYGLLTGKAKPATSPLPVPAGWEWKGYGLGGSDEYKKTIKGEMERTGATRIHQLERDVVGSGGAVKHMLKIQFIDRNDNVVGEYETDAEEAGISAHTLHRH